MNITKEQKEIDKNFIVEKYKNNNRYNRPMLMSNVDKWLDLFYEAQKNNHCEEYLYKDHTRVVNDFILKDFVVFNNKIVYDPYEKVKLKSLNKNCLINKINHLKNNYGYDLSPRDKNICKYFEQFYDNEGKIDTNTYKIKINNKLKDFVKLGHTGIDGGSCYNDRYSPKYKFNLAKHPNSFVGYVYTTKDKIIGRFWGVKHKNGVTCSNFYGYDSSYIKELTMEFFRKILGDKFKLIITPNDYLPKAVYRNKDAFSFIKKENK